MSMFRFHGVGGWELAEFRRIERRRHRPDGSVDVAVFGEWTYSQPDEPGNVTVSNWLESYRLTGKDAQ